MAEEVTLPAPVTVARTKWTISKLVVDVAGEQITVELAGDDGEILVAYYPTPTPLQRPGQPSGAALISTLNTVNLSTQSLVKRILNRLIADGYISGTVTGTPQ
jgi:hypothetical protein